MKGADINDFTLEDGWLKRGSGNDSEFARPNGEWGV